MFLASLVISLIVGVILTAIFVGLFHRRGPWSSVVAFFIVVFLTSWAGGIWITPFGPTVRSIQWLPFAVVGFVCSLILAASVPTWYSRIRTESGVQPERRKPPVALLTPYFWLTLVVLIVTIVAR